MFFTKLTQTFYELQAVRSVCAPGQCPQRILGSAKQRSTGRSINIPAPPNRDSRALESTKRAELLRGDLRLVMLECDMHLAARGPCLYSLEQGPQKGASYARGPAAGYSLHRRFGGNEVANNAVNWNVEL